MTAAPEAPECVLVDGQEAARLAPTDRGLHYGDGLFETIVCRGGRLRFLELHLERLAEGARRLRIGPVEPGAIRRELEALAAGRPACLLKLVLTRGPAVRRGYGPTGAERPTRIVLRYALPPEAPLAAPLRVRIATLRLGENPSLAGIKHLNRLEQVLARAEWQDERIGEALLFSGSGRLVSGTMSNVFLVDRQRLLTPALDRCGVAGVMRRVVLREARRMGCEVHEGELDAADLERVRELFLTNVRIGVRPVCAVGARALAPGPLTLQLAAAVEALDA